MKAVVKRCEGIDVGKLRLNVCPDRSGGSGSPCGLMTVHDLQCGTVQAAKVAFETGCTQAVMESTGSYGKPVYAALEDSGVHGFWPTEKM